MEETALEKPRKMLSQFEQDEKTQHKGVKCSSFRLKSPHSSKKYSLR